MIIRSNFVERRKHNRFEVKEGAVAGFHKPFLFGWGKSRIVKSAKITDISLDGLAFQYIDQNMWSPKYNELSISKTDDEIKIEKVPFKAVSDFTKSRLPNAKFLRRCGIRFGKLTPNQKHQLHYFIQDNTSTNQPMDRRTAKNRRRSGASKVGNLERRDKPERRKRLL